MSKLDRLQKIVFFLIKDVKIVKSQKDLMSKLGYKNETYMSQIMNGHVHMPHNIGYKLKGIYPQLNLDWFEDGSGTMLISGAGEPMQSAPHQITIGDGNVAASGQSNINVNTPADYIDLVRETQRQTSEMQKQSAEVLRQTAKMQEILISIMDKLNT